MVYIFGSLDWVTENGKNRRVIYKYTKFTTLTVDDILLLLGSVARQIYQKVSWFDIAAIF